MWSIYLAPQCWQPAWTGVSRILGGTIVTKPTPGGTGIIVAGGIYSTLDCFMWFEFTGWVFIWTCPGSVYGGGKSLDRWYLDKSSEDGCGCVGYGLLFESSYFK